MTWWKICYGCREEFLRIHLLCSFCVAKISKLLQCDDSTHHCQHYQDPSMSNFKIYHCRIFLLFLLIKLSINLAGLPRLSTIISDFHCKLSLQIMVGGREIFQISLLFLIKLPIFLAKLLLDNIANIIAPGLVLGMVKKKMLKSKDLAGDSPTNGNKFKWGNIESSADVAFFMSLDKWVKLFFS